MANEELRRCDEEMTHEQRERIERRQFHLANQESKLYKEKLEDASRAVRKLYNFFRFWKAKNALRIKCKTRYQKIFNADYHQFYYLDRITVCFIYLFN